MSSTENALCNSCTRCPKASRFSMSRDTILYIQSLMDKLKEEGSLDLAAIDWNSFEIADVTIPYFQERAGSDANGWIKGVIYRMRKAPSFQSRRRVFF